MSLRTRLLVGMAFVAIVLVVVAVVVTSTTRDELIGQLDARLASFSPGGGRELPTGARDPTANRRSRLPTAPPNVRATPSRATRSRRRPRHRVRPQRRRRGVRSSRRRRRRAPRRRGAATSPSTPPRVPDVPRAGSAVRRRHDDHRLPLDDVQRTISRLVVVEVVGSLAILAALGLVSWWVVHLGIRPVKEMTRTATRSPVAIARCACRSRLRARNRASWRWPSTRCSGASRASLDQRAASGRRLRRFVADAALMRTPVTTIRAMPSCTATEDCGIRRRSTTRCGAPSRKRRASAASSRTCWRWRGSTSSARSTSVQSTSTPLPATPRPTPGRRRAAHRRRPGDRPSRHRGRRGSAPPGDRQRRRQRPGAHRSAGAGHDRVTRTGRTPRCRWTIAARA